MRVFLAIFICFFTCSCSIGVGSLTRLGGPRDNPEAYHGLREKAYASVSSQQRKKNFKRLTDGKIAALIDRELLNGNLTPYMSIYTVFENNVIYLYGTVPSKTVADRAYQIAVESRRKKGKVVSYLKVAETALSTTNQRYPFIANNPNNRTNIFRK